MKRTLIGLIAFLIIMFPLRIYAEEWNELTGLLDDSLQLVKRNEDEKSGTSITTFLGAVF